MLNAENKYSIFSGVSKYRFRRILYIALFWTAIDLVAAVLNDYNSIHNDYSLLIRSVLVFFMSLFMGYLFVFTLKSIFKRSPLWINFLTKTVILLCAAFVITFLIHFVDKKLILGLSGEDSLNIFFTDSLEPKWLIKRTLYWIVLFVVTQLFLEINDKYSPGVFVDILAGKYIKPKIENRIVMFIDLKDSTPIAEKLGHQQYFLFIREFIFHLSMALIEHGGIIYQYVGDEIVVSWPYSKSNTKNCLAAVIECRKNIQKNGENFRRLFNLIPEFRVGIHVGDVTVGEIGVIKKDLAMSGDTMNTTARIRSACNELNQKFIVSKEFIESSLLQDFQSESLGIIELKGKASGLELFALKI
jgi:adenylate cyclase